MKTFFWKNVFVENKIEELEKLVYSMTDVVHETGGYSELWLI